MATETVQIVTQYICCMMFSFFLVKTFDGISLYFRFQEKKAKWYLMMCASTVIYVAAVFGVAHPGLGTTHSSWIIRLGWISGFFANYCYLNVIELFLDRKVRIINYSKNIILFTLSFQILGLLGLNLTHDPTPIESSYLTETFHITESLNSFGMLVAGIFSSTIVITHTIILAQLLRSKVKEILLIIGIILTFISVTNDILLFGFGLPTIMPLFYIANFFEAVRFSVYFRNKLHKKIIYLSTESIEHSTRKDELKNKSLLIKTLFHDINNGLMIAEGGNRILNLLIQKDADKAEIQKKIDIVSRGISTIRAVSETVHEMDVQNLGNSEILKKRESLLKLIQLINIEYMDRLERKNIRVKITKHDVEDLYYVKTDPRILKNQIIANIFSNAIKFSNSHTNIEIGLSRLDDKICLSILNFGACIDKVIVENIFDTQITDNPKAGTVGEKGHGYGLYIMKNFADQLGIEIKIETYDGSKQSTRFDLMIDSGTPKN